MVDVYGNFAPATYVNTTFLVEFGEFQTSSSGIGYWDFLGRVAGFYTIEFIQDDAVH
jgi:hypothetical protein